jgi:hypothetical protein
MCFSLPCLSYAVPSVLSIVVLAHLSVLLQHSCILPVSFAIEFTSFSKSLYNSFVFVGSAPCLCNFEFNHYASELKD